LVTKLGLVIAKREDAYIYVAHVMRIEQPYSHQTLVFHISISSIFYFFFMVSEHSCLTFKIKNKRTQNTTDRNPSTHDMGKDDETKNKVETFVITPQSPYYLSPSDSPGALITAIRFDGKNYDHWKQAVRAALRVKNKLDFVDRTITKPDTTGGDENLAKANAWEMVNSMITSWIMNVIDPKLHASVAYANSAHAMLENIQK